jgi:mannose-1-phosphate guanylyltransferase
VLAGGEGRRLKPLIQRLRGDSLPKQYVGFTGAHSMIEHTFRRAERLIPRTRLFTVVTQSHLSHPLVVKQLSRRPPGTVVTQGVLLPLMHIQKHYPNAVVAMFPSDQFVREEDLLMRYVRLASVIVKRHPASLVLLGMTPAYAEPEYGYIVPGMERRQDGWGTCTVGAFIEKPGILHARELIARGALWNSMVMVFNAGALLQWVKDLRPDVHRQFERIQEAIGTAEETTVLREVYERIVTIDFSKDFLEPWARQRSDRVVALPVDNVTWSDWGSEKRIVDTLARIAPVAAPAAHRQKAKIRLRANEAAPR